MEKFSNTDIRKFSDGEFNAMLCELFDSEQATFDTLCMIADKQLKPLVRKKCSEFSSISRRLEHEDVMQEVHIRLITRCVTGFFFRNGAEEPNRNPDEFCKWMYRVAKNVICDYGTKTANIDLRVRFWGEDEEYGIIDDTIFEEDILEDARERLKKAFAIVLDADASIYKTLVWIAQCIVITRADVTKIQSNEILINEFSDKTLSEMRDIIIKASKLIRWMEFTSEQLERINSSLNQPFKDGKTYGETTLKSFFMKQGGKKSLSDWANRMNNLINRRIKNETSDD